MTTPHGSGMGLLLRAAVVVVLAATAWGVVILGIAWLRTWSAEDWIRLGGLLLLIAGSWVVYAALVRMDRPVWRRLGHGGKQ